MATGIGATDGERPATTCRKENRYEKNHFFQNIHKKRQIIPWPYSLYSLHSHAQTVMHSVAAQIFAARSFSPRCHPSGERGIFYPRQTVPNLIGDKSPNSESPLMCLCTDSFCAEQKHFARDAT
jgi:hypothetical protein